MSVIKIWHPELHLVGEQADEFESPNHPLRLRGWLNYPSTPEQATDVLGRSIHDLFSLSNDELIRVALASANAQPEDAGTVKDVLAWVGDDKDRAATAKANEQTRDEPRSTLIADLDKILA